MEQHADNRYPAISGRVRQALLARAEGRIDLRDRRAERLVRLRAAPAPEAPSPEPQAPVGPGSLDELKVPSGDVEALEEFLAGLLGTIEPDREPPPQPARLSPAVIPLGPRPAEALASPPKDAAGLARLPGAGPDLIAALIRTGIPDLGSLARLDAMQLRDRLGPLALLIDVGGWIRFAQREVAGGAARV